MFSVFNKVSQDKITQKCLQMSSDLQKHFSYWLLVLIYIQFFCLFFYKPLAKILQDMLQTKKYLFCSFIHFLHLDLVQGCGKLVQHWMRGWVQPGHKLWWYNQQRLFNPPYIIKEQMLGKIIKYSFETLRSTQWKTWCLRLGLETVKGNYIPKTVSNIW